jgi:uncharacterized membrane protein
MKTTNYVIAAAIASVIFGLLFFSIITYVIPTIFYSSHVMKSAEDNDDKKIIIALMIGAAGLCYFVIRSLPEYNRPIAGAVYGAVYAGFMMAFYNAMNMALLNAWATKASVIGTMSAMATGALTGGVAAYIYDLIGNRKRERD